MNIASIPAEDLEMEIHVLNQKLRYEPDQPAEIRQDLTELLNRDMGIEIRKIVKFEGSDSPVYWMETGADDITIGNVNNILGQRKFRELAAAASNHLIPKYRPSAWEIRAQALLNICEKTAAPVSNVRRQAARANRLEQRPGPHAEGTAG